MTHPSFPDWPAPDGARPRVCIVTAELVGPFRNGGIGTSMTGLACALAAAGFDLTVLYTAARDLDGPARERWRAAYARLGVKLEWLAGDPARLRGPVAGVGFGTPYLVYQALRPRDFDILHFNDCMGEGYLCLAMKRLGLAFQRTTTVVALHSPSQWVFELNRNILRTPLAAAFNYAERLSVRAADIAWSPSRYLLGWLAGEGFRLPAATFVERYVLPPPGLFDPGAALPEPRVPDAGRRVPRELAFFGRLEERKGLSLFCDAIERLGDRLAASGVAVTFLGKLGMVGDTSAGEFLRARSTGWRFSWRIVDDLGQQEALAYLRGRDVLAIMASPADNSPCTVYEALRDGLRFVAARTGGIPELIDAADHAAVLFDHDAGALAAKLSEALDHGVAPARASFDQPAMAARWAAIVANLPRMTPDAPAPDAALGWLAVVDRGNGGDLDATLQSLRTAGIDQTFVLDRDSDHGALIDRLAHDPGLAILFLHAGSTLIADALPGAAEALRRPDVDGLVPAAAIGADGGGSVAPPLGGGQAFGFFQGAAHTGALIVKAGRLVPHLSRQTLARDVEFANIADLALAAGLDLWPFAEPLLRCPGGRIDPDRLLAPERIAAYAGATPVERRYMLSIALAAGSGRFHTAGRVRSIRALLARLRLGWVERVVRRLVPRRAIEALLAGR